ncbi:MAG: YbaN family protein [Vagococcus sp.]
MKSILFISLGCITFALGSIGLFLPILPTTPFYLATTFFWVNSSDRLHQRFIQTNAYQTYVQDMVVNKNMSNTQLARMLVTLFFIMLIPFVLVNQLHVRIVLIVVYIAHLILLPWYIKRKK